MAKLTFKGLSALALVSIEIKKEEKQMQSKKVMMEKYDVVVGQVAQPRGMGSNDPKKLRVKPRFVQKVRLTPIQEALRKEEMRAAGEQAKDKAYKAWAEAVARRHYKDVCITATEEEMIEARTVRDLSLTAKRS